MNTPVSFTKCFPLIAPAAYYLCCLPASAACLPAAAAARELYSGTTTLAFSSRSCSACSAFMDDFVVASRSAPNGDDASACAARASR